MNTILFILIVVTIVTTYLFLIRPYLKETPALHQLYEQEASWYAAVSVKFAGLKQYLTTVLGGASFFVIEFNDQVLPLLQQAGIDIDVHKIAPSIPPEVWPFISFGALALVWYFRQLANKRGDT